MAKTRAECDREWELMFADNAPKQGGGLNGMVHHDAIPFNPNRQPVSEECVRDLAQSNHLLASRRRPQIHRCTIR
jgi:hypothetical protein